MRALRKNQNALGLVLLALILLMTALVPYARVAAAPTPQQITCSEEDLAFAWPFEKFVFGVFGRHTTISYGQKSWDLFGSGGTHPPVLSPINGSVTANHTDAKGNTVLKIENNCRYVYMLHGNWDVSIGDQILIGNVVGTQDNNGQSWGADGQPCNGAEGCAEHVHLDVYDKVKGDWIDPRTDELTVSPTRMNEPLPEKLSYVVPDSPAELQETVQTGRGDLSHWLFANWIWFVLAFALIFVIVGSQHGLSLRSTLAIVGIGLLIYAWWIPSTSTWLESPVDGSIPIQTHYGDVRVDPQGTTATTWTVVAGTPIRAVAPGIVVNTPDPLEGYFGYQQIWIDSGNGLFVQYAMPASSSKKVLSGTKIEIGQELGITAAGEFRLGVSSKSPDEFVSIDDRTYGWMDPEEYLGKSTLSGGRKNEVVFMGVGFVLLIIALFWPKKEEFDEFTFPWNRSMARYQNIKLILGFCIVAIGIMLDGPWFMWLGTIPLSLSLTYFIGRLSYRRSSEWGVSTKSYLMSIFSMIFETTLVVGLIVAGVANPNIVFIRSAIALELPNVTTPRLPDWDLPQMASNSNVATPDDGDLIPSAPTYNLSNTHAIEPFTFRYWNGGQYRVDVPQEVWDASVAADQKHGCDYRLIIAVAWTESPNFTNHTSENYARAMGTWQFIPGTWNNYWPDPATRPSRTDVYASADAACRKVVKQGLPQTDGNRALYVERFAHKPLAESVWNMHDGQAGTAYDLWQELKKRTSGTPTTPQESSAVAQLSDWTLLTQATGTGVYQSGSNFLAIADLSKGAQVVLTGGNQCTPMEDHWQELGANPVFISNATYYESSCETTFPFIKNGVEVSSGAKTSQYTGARYLAISGNHASVLTYTDWVSGTRVPYMTAGLSPSAETARNAYTLVGVSANGQLVLILQVTSSTPQQGVAMLVALGIPDSNIILLDGGGSTQGIYATGYTRNTGRLIPQGIGIISP